MKVPLPSDIVKLIEEHKAHGDLVSISRRITKTEEDKEGNTSRSFEISTAIKNGYGEHDVVKEVCEFYREKEKVINEINSI